MAGLATVSGEHRKRLLKKMKTSKKVPTKHEYDTSGQGKKDQTKR